MPFTVLVIEDDPDTRVNLRDILELDGYQVEDVGTVAEALSRDDWSRYGAILLDRRLPDGTAEALLPQLRLKAPDAAVVVVTGHTDIRAAIEAFRLGAADYALKPIDPDELRARIGRIAGHHFAREALQRREEELRAVLDALPVGIWFTDAAGKVAYGNPAARAIWGGAVDVGIDATFGRKAWWPGSRRPVEPGEWALARALRGEPALDDIVEIETADGIRKVILASAIPLRTPNGTIRGAVVINQDVTDRRQAEAALQTRTEELKATTQQLWQAARLAGVGELAASIAHELNNPLAIVNLHVERLLTKTPTDDPRRKALTVVDGEVRRMAKLVSNLLGFSRVGRDQVSEVDLRDEAAKTIELIDHHLRKRQVVVHTEFAHDTPVVNADRQQVRQVLLNLLTNAADAMPVGGKLTVRVRPAELAARPAASIEVIDTGTGIPAEHLERIFDPFFTTKEEGKGTGLGLAICKRIVDEHHGTLEVESTVRVGTSFRASFPVQPPTDASGPRPA